MKFFRLKYVLTFIVLLISIFWYYQDSSRSDEAVLKRILDESGLSFSEPPIALTLHRVAQGFLYSDFSMEAVYLLSPKDKREFEKYNMAGFELRPIMYLGDMSPSESDIMVCSKSSTVRRDEFTIYEIFDGYLVFRYLAI